MIVWVQMQEEIAGGELANELAQRFSDYGDFNVHKDSQSSFFMEFFYFEPTAVPTQTTIEFVKILNAGENAKKRGVKEAMLYKDATKFKAHNRLSFE